MMERLNEEQRALVEENLGLVYKVIYRYFRDRCPHHKEDMAQEGMLGMIRAASTYDAGVGKFSTYATIAVLTTIRDAIPWIVEGAITVPRRYRKRAWDEYAGTVDPRTLVPGAQGYISDSTVRSARAAAAPMTSISEDDSVQAEDPGYARVDRTDADRVLRAFLGDLDDADREVLEMRYGLVGEPLLLKEVGREREVTRERIRQIQGRATRTLAHRMRTSGVTADCLL